MKQQDAKPEQALPHDLILEGRNKLTVTGVRRVIRCDAEGAEMLTSKGTLELTGAELSVTSLDLDKGEVHLKLTAAAALDDPTLRTPLTDSG